MPTIMRINVVFVDDVINDIQTVMPTESLVSSTFAVFQRAHVNKDVIKVSQKGSQTIQFIRLKLNSDLTANFKVWLNSY